jgi:quercetin dioxygenase-like cupin family protein
MVAHPEWAFVSVVLAADKEKQPRVCQAPGFVGCGKDTVFCCFCDKSFAGLVDRIRNHVAGGAATGLAGVVFCPGPRARDGEPPAELAERKAQFAAARASCATKNAELRAAAEAQERKRALDKATAPELYVPGGAKPRPQKQLRLDSNSAINLKATEDLARGFYSAGIAPNVLTNKLFRRALLSVAQAGADWRPPSAEETLGTLLNREHARVKAAINDLQGTASRVGITLVGDGATNVNRQPILNVLFVRGDRVEFVKAQDCSGHVKDGRFIADDIIGVIERLDDPKSVVLVLMDNATRKAWPLIEAACPWVVCGPCGPHVADLLQEDVGKLPFFKALFAKAFLEDPDTGVTVRMVKYPAGFMNAWHTHPCAHGMFVLEGTLVTHKGNFAPGNFVWFPQGMRMEHGATQTEDVTVLFITNKKFEIWYEKSVGA